MAVWVGCSLMNTMKDFICFILVIHEVLNYFNVCYLKYRMVSRSIHTVFYANLNSEFFFSEYFVLEKFIVCNILLKILKLQEMLNYQYLSHNILFFTRIHHIFLKFIIT